ncbi:uncharacterized protein BX663DRAFT_316556 [Cokeromyces recurvatus]|uniref:uncharacterized protein n=1 Tax=Cokeromyces recurvatus TaxID=90255 RepID=UPI00221F9D8B|nr:uncharacterized protein BX663DRAFT_316556 [Cokeromyces recurvatus]KAI7905293.1 hypothetical protein BX663DRAFT_316556 [Cokeromyces recurvatus]
MDNSKQSSNDGSNPHKDNHHSNMLNNYQHSILPSPPLRPQKSPYEEESCDHRGRPPSSFSSSSSSSSFFNSTTTLHQSSIELIVNSQDNYVLQDFRDFLHAQEETIELPSSNHPYFFMTNEQQIDFDIYDLLDNNDDDMFSFCTKSVEDLFPQLLTDHKK